MRREFTVALLLLRPLPFIATQGPASPTIYYASPGVTAPELLPAHLIHGATGHCDKFDRSELLSAVVDETGAPRAVSLINPAGTDLDKIAINIATADRFKPGKYNGAPVSAAISIELKIYSCIETNTNEQGQRIYSLQLRTLPDQKVDLERLPSNEGEPAIAGGVPASNGASSAPHHVNHDVTAPVLLRSVEAEPSERAREERISGVCLVSLIVDMHGIPLNVHVVKSLEPTLDENAVNAVRQYRFRPAMKDGKAPVSVMVTIEVDFRLY